MCQNRLQRKNGRPMSQVDAVAHSADRGDERIAEDSWHNSSFERAHEDDGQNERRKEPEAMRLQPEHENPQRYADKIPSPGFWNPLPTIHIQVGNQKPDQEELDRTQDGKHK